MCEVKKQLVWDAENGCIRAVKPLRPLKDGERRVPTGLVGKKANEVLNSVIGQMSDGMWENSPAMEKYWLFCNIDDDNSIIVNTGVREYCGRWKSSGFAGKSDDDVRRFFASKICAILKEFRKYYPNEEYCDFLSYHEQITCQECKDIAKALRNGVA